MTTNRPPYIVGIGASAGGLEALEHFFAAVPDDSQLCFIVIQHLSPNFKSLMVELLERHTTLPVLRIEDGLVAEPGHIYLNPPRRNVLLSDGQFRLLEQQESGGLNMPIDVFFRSLARDAGTSAIGVVLSGTGSDGSRGIVEIHRVRGLVAAQDLDSSSFDGMPRSAQASGICHLTAPPAELAHHLHDYAKKPEGFLDRIQEVIQDVPPEIASLLQIFRNNYGIDFAQYKPATFHRRLERRMRLDGYHNIESYLEHLRDNTDKLNQLYRDVLVEVTEFFRDNEAFDTMRNEVVADLVRKAPTTETLRIWVAGCATGEEAYSVAMLLLDACEKDGRGVTFKVFATDVHQNSLQIASSGVYTAQAVDTLPPDFRNRFCEKRQDLYHIREDLRRCVLFAPHDVTRDPPFTKCDLVTCRNMLIYLLTDVQQRAIANFHFALKVNGVLFLGPSETTGSHENEFEVINQRWRIYRKLRDVRLGEVPRNHLSTALRQIVRSPVAAVAAPILHHDDERTAHHILQQILEEHLPPSLLINSHYELVHSFGEARRILVQPQGTSTLDVLRMVEGDLRTALGAALNRAARQDTRAAFRRIKVGNDEAKQQVVDLSVTPYEKSGNRMYLVRLENQQPTAPDQLIQASDEVFDSQDGTNSRINELEEELQATRETLKAAVEDLEAANEELQSTNEELVASNEELQSTNEELHSVNEELYTVNAEHQRKIEELTELSADMDNLLTCTEIGTIFLDRDRKIRSFTPAIAETFHMLDRDVGRPIEHIASKLENLNVSAQVSKVLETTMPTETRVQSADGEVFLQRITPYRSASRTIEGVVLTYVSVPQLQDSESRFDELVKNLRDVVWICSPPDGSKVEYVNDEFERIWGISADALYADGSAWIKAIVPEDRERVRSAFAEDLRKGEFNVRYRIRRPDGQVRWIHDQGHPVIGKDGQIAHFAGVARDVTAEQMTAISLTPLMEGSNDSMMVFDLETGNIVGCNTQAETTYGYSREELVTNRLQSLVDEPRTKEVEALIRQLRDGEAVSDLETERRQKDGTIVKLRLNAWPTTRNDRAVGISIEHVLSDDATKTPRRSDEQPLG